MVAKYLQAYAIHFDLLKRCRLGVAVDRLQRSSDGSQWELCLSDKTGSHMAKFDKVLFATGPYNVPYTPRVPGMESFRGKLLHSQAFKRLLFPLDFSFTETTKEAARTTSSAEMSLW